MNIICMSFSSKLLKIMNSYFKILFIVDNCGLNGRVRQPLSSILFDEIKQQLEERGIEDVHVVTF
jgi:hypothetical protein